MNLRCNICSEDVDEKEIENHIKTEQHNQSKSKISSMNGRGSDKSIIGMWHNSLND